MTNWGNSDINFGTFKKQFCHQIESSGFKKTNKLQHNILYNKKNKLAEKSVFDFRLT
jgi:hypothetical protein